MRRFALKCLAVAALLGLGLLGPSPAAAEELVKFAGAAAVFPQAEAVGNGAHLPRSETDIQGYLTKPKGNGPFPAVVLLHSCLGLPSDRRSIGRTLAGWGYVALFVDDFATRGLTDTCAVDFPEGLADAYGALAFITGLPYVDRTRVAAVGFSQGADTALEVASSRFAAAFAIPDDLSFKAAAAFYPPCGNLLGARLLLPTLILVGAADAVTPASYCEQLARSAATADVKLVVYPGVGHVFDDPQFAGGKEVLGMWLQFDQRATAQSRSELRAFLAAKLKR
jgi:dienelactone hydrolase